MPPVQDATDYALDHPAALAGMPVNLKGNKFISRVAEGVIPFGRIVTRGSGSRSCILPTAAGDVLGVSHRTLAIQANSSEVVEYADKREVGILEEGEIWLECDETVVEGDDAFYVNGSGAGVAGRVRNDAAAGDATVLVNAKIESGGTIGQLVKLKIPAAVQG